MRKGCSFLAFAALAMPVGAQAAKQLWVRSAHMGSVEAIDISPDGNRIVTAGDDGHVRVWDYKTGQQVTELAFHFDGAECATFSRDGQLIATGGIGRQIHVHRTSDWQTLYSLDETGFVEDLAFTANGNSFYAGLGYSSNDMRGFRTVDGMPTSITHLHWGTVWSVAVSPVGQYLASSAADGRVIVFGGQYYQYLYDIAGHTDDVIKVRFSPNGGLLASLGEYDRRLILSSMPGGSLYRNIALGNLLAYGISFSPDSSAIAVCGQELPGTGKLFVYNVSTGSLLTKVIAPSNIRSVRFSPKSNTICYGRDDGKLICLALD